MNRNEFNFVSEKVSDADMELFMGPFESDDGPLIRFPDNWIMAHIMYTAGIFKSISDARRNGWDKPIPKGYQELTVSKRRVKIYILNELVEVQ